ncbi:MAG TPA: hypothetical protein VN650_01335 [Gemmatimonadaceae bacterium]|nr:hypothetical protein [Gemmatimonadaceae bacterium]
MMSRFVDTIVASLAVAALAVCIGDVAGAQGVALRQLDGRASASLKAQVTSVADSVAHTGLPVAPLVDKALEGISKGADDNRIMIAVRGVANDLGIARGALGPSSDNELAAAVAALRAGSTPAELTRLRKELPGRQLVVPLSVLASLIVDGAPAQSAIVAVVANARQRDDSGLLAYGRSVSHDIAGGVAPLTAITGTQATPNAMSTFKPAFTGGKTAPLPAPPKPKP